jgi:hypothetical protein
MMGVIADLYLVEFDGIQLDRASNRLKISGAGHARKKPS